MSSFTCTSLGEHELGRFNSELCQTPKKERFAKIVNDLTATIFAKSSILDV